MQPKPKRNRRRSTIPKPVQAELHRDRLIKRIRDANDASLIVLLAPAGYGKTTLLAQACRESSSRVAWLTLSEDEASALRLAQSVATVVQQALPKASFEHYRIAVSNDAVAEGLARALVADLNECDFNLDLVLDKIEHLGEDATKWVERFLNELDEGHRILIAGYDTTLPMAQLVASGSAIRLETSILAFTSEETAAYLLARGSNSDATQAHQILEGWCAGLALVAAGAAPQLEPRDLVREVLERLPKDLREVIAEAAVLDVWSEAEARKLGCNLPKGWLKSVQLAGLPMTPITAETHRPHTILLEVLTFELLKKPDLYKELNKAAATMALKSGKTMEVIKYLNNAGNIKKAIKIGHGLIIHLFDHDEFKMARQILEIFDFNILSMELKIRYAKTLIQTNEIDRGESLLNKLYKNDKSNHPLLLIYLSYQYFSRGDVQNYLNYTEKVFECSIDDDTKMQVLINKATGVWYSGNYSESLVYLREANLLAEKLKNLSRLEESFEAMIMPLLALGNRSEVEIVYKKAIEISDLRQSSNSRVRIMNSFATALSAWGENIKSLQLFNTTISMIKDQRDSEFLTAKLRRGIEYMRIGDFENALKDVDWSFQNIDKKVESGSIRFICMLLIQIYHYLNQKELAYKVYIFSQSDDYPKDSFRNSGEVNFIEAFQALFDGNLDYAKMKFENHKFNSTGLWDNCRVNAFIAEISRRQGRLNKSLVSKLVKSLDDLKHDKPLYMDLKSLSGLYKECIRRRWYADRFAAIIDYTPEAINPPKLEIFTFEALEIQLENGPTHLPLKKSAELLVWLALHGPVTRDEIITALWGKDFTSKDIEYFKVAARRLRTALSEHPSITFNPLPFEHGVYRIAKEFDLRIDAATLLSDTPDSSSDVLAVLESYKGDFLPGMEGDWIEQIRARSLDQLLERGLELGHQLEQLDPKDAIRVYDRIRALDELCEPAYRGLERVYLALDRETDAVNTSLAWQKALRS